MSRKLTLPIAAFAAFTILVWVLCGLWLSGATMLKVGVTLTVLGGTALGMWILLGRLKVAVPPSGSADSAASDGASAPAGAEPAGSTEFDQLIRQADALLAGSAALAYQSARKVSELPLFIVAGPANVGKTSLMLNSGLEPRLLIGQVTGDAGVPSTRVCNIWFANGAIYAEAGARVFQDPARWRSFLEALCGGWMPGRGSRLKGLLLTMDAAEFLGRPDASLRPDLSRLVLNQLREVGSVFRRDFPTYVVFNKSDAFPFFQDFFRNIRVEEERELPGCNIEPMTASARPAGQAYADAELERLSERFEMLYHNLTRLRLEFLAREGDVRIRSGGYEFAREFRKLKPRILQFLVDSFVPDQTEPGPLLRGFYFTGIVEGPGAGQEELSFLDALKSGSVKGGDATVLFRVGSLQPGASPASSKSQKRHIFVRPLFTKVLPGDAVQYEEAPAVETPAAARSNPWRKAGWIAAICLAAIFAILFTVSFFHIRDFLSEVQSVSAIPYDATPRDVTGPDLDRLRTLRQELDVAAGYDDSGVSWWKMGWFLYPHERLPRPMRELYFTRFRDWLLEGSLRSIEYRLGGLARQPSERDPYNEIYNEMKAYLMVTASPTRCEPAVQFLQDTLVPVWAGQRELPQEVTTKARAEYAYFAAAVVKDFQSNLRPKSPGGSYPYPLDDANDPAIRRGRDYLGRTNSSLPWLHAIVDQVNKLPIQAAALSQYTSQPDRHQVLMTGPTSVEKAYSYTGAQEVMRRIQNARSMPKPESCVLGEAAAFGAPVDPGALLAAYMQDYAQRWRDFLGSNGVLGYGGSYATASQHLGMLSENEDPLIGILSMVHENTNFQGDATPPPAGMAAGPFNGRDGPRAQAAISNILVPGDVTALFQPVHSLFPSRDLNNAATKDYLNALAELGRGFEELARAGGREDPGLNQKTLDAYDAGAKLVTENMSRAFHTGALGIDTQTTRLLTAPLVAAKGMIHTPEQAKRDKNAAGGASLCAKLRPVLRKYPFDPNASADAQNDEIIGIFAPGVGGGELWSYYNKVLSGVYVRAGRGKEWTVKPDASPDQLLGVPGERSFKHLTQISDALFPETSEQPFFRFTISIPPQDPAIGGVTLSINGQSVTTGESRQFEWRGSGDGLVKLTARAGTVDVPLAAYSGSWGLFTLMSQWEEHQTGSNRFGFRNLRKDKRAVAEPLTVSDKPVTIWLEVLDYPNGIEHAFEKDFFTGLACPTM